MKLFYTVWVRIISLPERSEHWLLHLKMNVPDTINQIDHNYSAQTSTYGRWMTKSLKAGVCFLFCLFGFFLIKTHPLFIDLQMDLQSAYGPGRQICFWLPRLQSDQRTSSLLVLRKTHSGLIQSLHTVYLQRDTTYWYPLNHLRVSQSNSDDRKKAIVTLNYTWSLQK